MTDTERITSLEARVRALEKTALELVQAVIDAGPDGGDALSDGHRAFLGRVRERARANRAAEEGR